MKRFFSIVLMLTALIALTGCGDSLSRKEYTIATGSKSGVYYSVGEALDKIIQTKYPDVTIKVIETDGSVDNIQMLKDGKVDLALIQNDIACYANTGSAMFEGNKFEGLSGIATLFPEVVQFIVRRDSYISKFSDLAGKKIAVGGKNSGTRYNVDQILGAAGVLDKVTCIYIDTKDAMTALEAGEIDGFVFTSGFPNPSIVELSKKVEIDLVSIDMDLTQKLVNDYAFYFPNTVDQKQYTGSATELNVLEISAILVSGPTLSDNDQYALTKALFNKPEELGQYHTRLNKITKARLRQQLPIKVGAGAEKAFTEE